MQQQFDYVINYGNEHDLKQKIIQNHYLYFTVEVESDICMHVHKLVTIEIKKKIFKLRINIKLVNNSLINNNKFVYNYIKLILV